MNESPQRPEWARERQPEPPNFGEAQRVSRPRLAYEVWRRRRQTRPILEHASEYCDFEPGLVSLVVLSCRRLPELRRLCETLVPFFRDVETYRGIETMLVDNGSGPELVEYARSLGFFDELVAHPENLGMVTALVDAYARCRGEYVLLVEDDFVLDHDRPFIGRAVDVLREFPELGVVRLKDQNNWWKPFRRIAPLRRTRSGVEFWTWLPSVDGGFNVWAAGSVLFRKASFFSTQPLPDRAEAPPEVRDATIYEELFGRRYNRRWLAAKIRDCYPFVQPNDNPESPGWAEREGAAAR